MRFSDVIGVKVCRETSMDRCDNFAIECKDVPKVGVRFRAKRIREGIEVPRPGGGSMSSMTIPPDRLKLLWSEVGGRLPTPCSLWGIRVGNRDMIIESCAWQSLSASVHCDTTVVDCELSASPRADRLAP